MRQKKCLERESIIQAITLRSASSWKYWNKQWPNIPRCHILQKHGNYARDHSGSRLLYHIQTGRVLAPTKTFYLVCRWRNLHSHYDIINMVTNENDNESLQPESRLHLQIHGQNKYWLAHDAVCHIILNSITQHLVPFQDQNLVRGWGEQVLACKTHYYMYICTQYKWNVVQRMWQHTA